jgi:hypothetical protein
MARYAMRRDLNDAEVVEAVKAAGYSVIDFTRAGLGIPDHLALRLLPQGTYFICWLEVKSKGGRLSEQQRRAREVWEPRGEWIMAVDPEETVRRLLELYLAKVDQESGGN